MCEARDSTILVCQTKSLHRSVRERRRRSLSNASLRNAVMSLGGAGALSNNMQPYPLGLQLDGVSTYRDLPAYVGDAGYLKVYPDPIIGVFSDFNQTRIVNGSHHTIELSVSTSCY